MRETLGIEAGASKSGLPSQLYFLIHEPFFYQLRIIIIIIKTILNKKNDHDYHDNDWDGTSSGAKTHSKASIVCQSSSWHKAPGQSSSITIITTINVIIMAIFIVVTIIITVLIILIITKHLSLLGCTTLLLTKSL